jgi:hypothetical protein
MESSGLIVYGLIDPRNGQVRYVGKSCSGLSRPRSHTSPANLAKERTHKANWLRGLVAVGLRPEIEVLEACDSTEALSEAERFYIGYFRMVGCALTNLTDGGDGASGYRHTEGAKVKVSAARRGKALGPQSDTHRARRSVSMKGKNPSRPVIDESGVRYSGVKAAAQMCGVSPGSVSQSARKGCRAGNHRFTFAKE